jgi:hypothetical protein
MVVKGESSVIFKQVKQNSAKEKSQHGSVGHFIVLAPVSGTTCEGRHLVDIIEHQDGVSIMSTL